LPPAPPPAWHEYLGEYGTALDPIVVLEHDATLNLLTAGVTLHPLMHGGTDTMRTADGGLAVFRRTGGKISALELDNAVLGRRPLGPDDGNVFRITPLHTMAELERMAAAAAPPVENGDFSESDLVELQSLDPSIHYDIRYATTSNFMGAVFYSQARAFLQRPAAEALVRAGAALRKRGYGLLIHDAYRPWYVTKMFWDATPDSLRKFVANPATGSRHNRGAAVDLSLYDLRTGEPVTMVSGYDEFSPRAYADYAGGTSRQRWRRALLRTALEAEGFTVNPNEWWHFDYRDWRRYRIGTERFEQLAR
ncbi:MAG TPA: M15 family metallopeptidase, partial [Longimicrobiales bacterium]